MGFDFQGINGKFNNVYADTHNYKKSSDTATFFGNWLNQTERVIKEYKHIDFIRVIETGSFVPDKFENIDNLTHMDYQTFQEQYLSTIYSDQIDQKTTI